MCRFSGGPDYFVVRVSEGDGKRSVVAAAVPAAVPFSDGLGSVGNSPTLRTAQK
jgi:hypothetical protein